MIAILPRRYVMSPEYVAPRRPVRWSADVRQHVCKRVLGERQLVGRSATSGRRLTAPPGREPSTASASEAAEAPHREGSEREQRRLPPHDVRGRDTRWSSWSP